MHFKTTNLFDKQSKKLAKKYKNLKNDLQLFVSNFEQIHQQSTTIKKNLYKTRLANSNKAKGKRAGYRIYYYIKLEDSIYLLTIYDKSDTEMIDEKLLIDTVENIEEM